MWKIMILLSFCGTVFGGEPSPFDEISASFDQAESLPWEHTKGWAIGLCFDRKSSTPQRVVLWGKETIDAFGPEIKRKRFGLIDVWVKKRVLNYEVIDRDRIIQAAEEQWRDQIAGQAYKDDGSLTIEYKPKDQKTVRLELRQARKVYGRKLWYLREVVNEEVSRICYFYEEFNPFSEGSVPTGPVYRTQRTFAK